MDRKIIRRKSVGHLVRKHYERVKAKTFPFRTIMPATFVTVCGSFYYTNEVKNGKVVTCPMCRRGW